MKRLFITTNVEKAILMYNRTGYEKEKSSIEENFKNFPKIYEFGKSFRIIIIDDSFEKWEELLINDQTDYILYHTSSEPNKIEIIQKTFSSNHIQNSSHILEELHDKVYRVIFSDKNDKPNSILNILNFTDKQIEEKNTLESQLNFLHHCLTSDGFTKEEVTKSEWANTDEFKKLQSATDGPFGDCYLKALRQLRDKLLVS